jgi:hypothetical protein
VSQASPSIFNIIWYGLFALYYSRRDVAIRFVDIADHHCCANKTVVLKNKLHYNLTYEEFEETKVVIRIRISKNRQYNGQKKKDKQRFTKHTHKTKDRVTQTPLKTAGELMCSGMVGSRCFTSGTRRVTVKR